MSIERLNSEIKKLREKTAELSLPGFTYYEQELIRRVIKAVITQMKDTSDISIANDILKKTEWLDNG